MSKLLTSGGTVNFKILTGIMSLPDTMYIGVDCLRKHGRNGKTVRYKSTGGCITCQKIRNSLSYPDKRDLTALQIFELKNESIEEDLW